MNGYHRRASFYRSEFAVRDDFPLLGRLLAGRDGMVVDIPSGAGRLLPVHQGHAREVIMVNIEPAMTAQCQTPPPLPGLASRVEGEVRRHHPLARAQARGPGES